MAFARDSFVASAAQTDFTETFPYLAEVDVVVTKDAVVMTNQVDADTVSYQIVSGTTIRFGAGLTSGDVVVIKRSTSQALRLVDYANASTLTETDLDDDSLQAFYMAQEAIDTAATALGLGASDIWDAETLRIENVVDPTANQDAATKKYGDDNWGGASATAAAASASAAATSETNAATSATDAATAKTAAELALDTFDDIFLGAKGSDPTLDNDGDALATGALYFLTTTNVMKAYTGSTWVNFGTTTFAKYTYSASGGQTVFSGSDANSNTMAFSNANQLVYLNGLYLREGASHDYVATSGTTITLQSGANALDVLEVFTATDFAVADAITQATADARYVQISSLVHPIYRGYIDGFITSPGTTPDEDVDIAAGQCVNAAGDTLFTGTAMTKQNDATWAAGTAAGGMNDAETVSADTWYAVHAIFNSSGGVDYGFDTSATAVNLLADTAVGAAGFDQGYRRIGWVQTDATSDFITWTQRGDDFVFNNPGAQAVDYSTDFTTTPVLITMRAPPLTLCRFVSHQRKDGTSSSAMYVTYYEVAHTTRAANISATPIAPQALGNNNDFGNGVQTWVNMMLEVWLDASRQIYGVSSATATESGVQAMSWMDPRGKDA